MSQVLSFAEWRRHGPFASRPQLHRSVVPEVGRRIIDTGPVHLINTLCPAGPAQPGGGGGGAGRRTTPAGGAPLNTRWPRGGRVAPPPVPEYAVHLVLRTPPLLQVGFNRRPRWLVMSPGVILAAPPDTG